MTFFFFFFWSSTVFQQGAPPLSKLWIRPWVVNVHDVLDIVKRTLVLLGNANDLISRARRSNILHCVDDSLEKYANDLRPNSGVSVWRRFLYTRQEQGGV